MGSYIDDLEEEVDLKNNVITYKWIVNHLRVSSNIAKQILYEFVEKQKSANKKVSVTYFVSGDRKLEDGTLSHEVYIVPEWSLESIKCKLTVVTSVHIYAVHKEPLKDPSILYSLDYHLTHSQDASSRFVTISCSNLTFRDTSKNKVQVKSESPVVSCESTTQKTSSEVKVKKNVSPVVSCETTTHKTSSEVKAAPVANDATKSNSKNSKGALTKMFANMNNNKVKTLPPATDTKKMSQNSDTSDTPVTNKKTIPKSTETKNIRTKCETSKKTKKKKNEAEEESNVRKRRRIIQMADSSEEESGSEAEDMSDCVIPIKVVPDPPLTSSKAEPTVNIEKPSVQNRHKRVLVEETTLDKDGYLVTQKFWKDEIETEIVKENKPAAVKSVETVDEKPANRSKQSTLMNFFKKK